MFVQYIIQGTRICYTTLVRNLYLSYLFVLDFSRSCFNRYGYLPGII